MSSDFFVTYVPDRSGVEPFITTGVDVENHFLDAKHLAAVNPGTSETDFQRLIRDARDNTKDSSIQHFVNGRIDIERSKGTHASIDHGKLAVETARAVETDPAGKSHGKTVLKRLRSDFQKESRSTLQDFVVSKYISVEALKTIAKKVFRGKGKQIT
jgi:hypothetical protein